jgi:hypothetical protein
MARLAHFRREFRVQDLASDSHYGRQRLVAEKGMVHMRAKRSLAPSMNTLDPETPLAGAVRAVEPVFEQIARETHLRSLIPAGVDNAVVYSIEQWRARGGFTA